MYGKIFIGERFYENSKIYCRSARGAYALGLRGLLSKQDTGRETLGAADGKTDEAVSEQKDESPASDANDPASDSDGSTPAPDGSTSAPDGNTVAPNGGSRSGSGKPAGQTQKPTSAPTAATAKPDVKKSKYFLGTDLDGWYHWNQIGEGFQRNTEYIAIWDKEYNSRGNIVKQSSYDRLGDEIRPYGQCFYEYSYNGDGTVKEIRRSGYFPATFRYEYDAAKRITKVTKSDPATGEVTDTLTLSYSKSGKLACAAGSDWKVLSSYDGSGRLTKKRRPTTASSKRLLTNTTAETMSFAKRRPANIPTARTKSSTIINMPKTAL